MAPELHLNSYTWVQDEKLGFQSRLSQNRRNVSCVLSGVFVLDRRLLVNVSLGGGESCQMPQNPKCSLYRPKTLECQISAEVSERLLNHVTAAEAFPGQKNGE